MYCKTGERFMKARTIYNKNGNQNKKEAAAGAGVTESILSNIENDDIDRDVGCSHVIALANYYGVATDYLLGISDIPKIDLDLKNACEYLGLSANTVEAIHSEFNNEMKSILDELIDNTSFRLLLIRLCMCRLYAKQCKNDVESSPENNIEDIIAQSKLQFDLSALAAQKEFFRIIGYYEKILKEQSQMFAPYFYNDELLGELPF